MFLASKLVYAMKFYSIPKNFQDEIQSSIFDFVNHPNKVVTIAQKEMWKIKSGGGCKLVNAQIKSATSKAKWLMELATNKDRKVNLALFTELTGRHKGNTFGKDLIFRLKPYITRLKEITPFYREALMTVTTFDRVKGIPEVKNWDEENIFYNPLVKSRSDKTLVETDYFHKRGIYKLGQLLEEKSKEARGLPHDKKQVSLIQNIVLVTGKKTDTVWISGKPVEMATITQKDLYEEAIMSNSTCHSHQIKWAEKLDILIVWEEVWDSVHNLLLSNHTKTAIWEQIHLNFYTQYSYNKWHNTNTVCPLCNSPTESIFHLILHCTFVNTLWTLLHPTLTLLVHRPLSDEEKAFGIVHIKKTPGMLVRNFLTYKMREHIMQSERAAYHTSKAPSIDHLKVKINQDVASEVKRLLYRFNEEGKISTFDKIVAHQGILCEQIGEGEYRLKKVFN